MSDASEPREVPTTQGPAAIPAQVGGQGRGLATGTAVAIGAAALKAKGALGLLKALPFMKMLPTVLSMGAMIWFEAMRSGLAFGVGFVLLILIHELGHGFAIKRAGLEAGWPVFIPFFGAMIALKGKVASAAVEAEIAYAGPVAGTAASLVCAGAGLALDSRFLISLAYVGFFLNLFNLVPFGPLDGGRVAQAFSKRGWIIGAVVLGGLFLVAPSIQLALIAGLGLMHAFSKRQHEELPPEQQRTWMVRYFGLCFFLGAALFFCSRLLGRSL
jgi:Zn-dependent protease